MRGKVADKPDIIRQHGITPAYAGKSRKPVHCRKPVQDHPRLCGEKEERYCRGYDVIGSPPPMRGKDQAVKNSNERTRITPAYAGKRHFKDVRLCCHWDHPRLCGEKHICTPAAVSQKGSPPPMRGKEDAVR